MDLSRLTAYAKAFTGLTPEKEAVLIEAGPAIKPELPGGTQRFYDTLQTIERTAPYIEGGLDQLKSTHLAWLQGLFTAPSMSATPRPCTGSVRCT
jgi:hypothetical protein